MNTIPPNDFSYFEMLNEIVQQEPATSLDPELMGPIAAIGIVKGKPFAPDARMKKILTEARRARQRHLAQPVHESARSELVLLPRLGLVQPPVRFRLRVRDADPDDHAEGVKPFPPTGYRQLDARRWFFYGVTGITPAMAMRVTGIGSQYLFAMLDADKNYFDGSKTYKVTLPKDIPEANFWSFTLYDNQTRSMLDTPQRYPRAGSQSYPSPAAEAERRRLDDGLLRSDAARRASSAATGFRPIRRRAGSRSCASTARSNRSSRRSGGRARSNWFVRHEGGQNHEVTRIRRFSRSLSPRRPSRAGAAGGGRPHARDCREQGQRG